MVGEDHRPIGREEGVELDVRKAVGMLARRLQLHQVDNVHEPHPEVRQMLVEQVHRGGGLERRHVAGAGHHDVGVAALVVARPVPDPDSPRAVGDRLVHAEIVERRLLPGNHDVDVLAAAQAVVGDREQAVGVGRQVDTDDLGFLVHDEVDEARVLVREAVVVLPPDVRGKQVVERRDGAPPGNLVGDLEPLRVLIDHRVDDVDEGLVAAEQAVSSGEQVALQPALAHVLAEHLHDPPVGRKVLVQRS